MNVLHLFPRHANLDTTNCDRLDHSVSRLVLDDLEDCHRRFAIAPGVLGAQGKGELTYVCVPVTVSGRTAGTLGVALPHRKDRRYDQETARLSIVGAMLGQAVRVHRLVEAERSRLVEENTKLRHELKERYQIRSLIGNSRPMQQLYDQVAQVAPSSTTVLVRGESGTGKELVAHAIHYGSPRADRPLGGPARFAFRRPFGRGNTQQTD